MYSAYIRTETETGGSLRFDISRAEGEANIEPQTSDRRGRGPYIRWNTPHIHGSYNIYHDIRFAEPAKTSTLPCYMRFTVRAKTSLAVLLPSLSWFGVSLCTMSKLPRPLKHPRNDFESDSDFEDMPKHKARRVCQPQRFVAVSEADVDASKKPIVVKNTEKATAWAVGVFMSWIEERNERNEEQCPMEVLCCRDNAAEHFHWTLLLVSLFDPRHEDSDSPRCSFLSVFHHDGLGNFDIVLTQHIYHP